MLENFQIIVSNAMRIYAAKWRINQQKLFGVVPTEPTKIALNALIVILTIFESGLSDDYIIHLLYLHIADDPISR